MKKMFLLLLVLALLWIPTGMCETEVYSEMTDEELILEVSKLQDELSSRGTSQEIIGGVYKAGTDIAPGKYVIKELSNGGEKSDTAWWVLIYSDESQINSFYTSDLTLKLASSGSVSVSLSEGQFLKIEIADASIENSKLMITKSSPLFMD